MGVDFENMIELLEMLVQVLTGHSEGSGEILHHY